MNFLYSNQQNADRRSKESVSICLSLTLLCFILSIPSAFADESVTVKETNISTTAPANSASTVTVEHTKSVMEPSVVQETVGSQGRTVQPLIMERKDKLLDKTTYTTRPSGSVMSTTTVVKDAPADPPQVIQKTESP
jgi:hypothetical protein